MSTITFLLTTLFLSPILSFPIEPRHWGRAQGAGLLTAESTPGFIGERPITGPDGDYLRATYCYCKTAMPTIAPRTEDDAPKDNSWILDHIEPGEIVQGHYWRYEYFNYHYNATYFMNHYCMEDAFPRDTFGCGNDSPGGFEPTPETGFDHTFKNDYALTYQPLPDHKLHSWTIYKKHMDNDWMMFGRGDLWNQQKRRLGPEQGLIMMPQEYVDDKCSHYCEKELMLPMDSTMRSHSELYNKVDDMCDRCK